MTEPRPFASVYIDEDVTSRLAVALCQRGFEAIAAHEAGLVSDADEVRRVGKSTRANGNFDKASSTAQ